MIINETVKDKRAIKRFNSLEAAFNTKHNSKYSYSNSVYVSARTPLVVTCPTHGDWFITPDNHLRGNGCPGCNSSNKSTTSAFVLKSVKIHNNKYTYEKVVYVRSNKKVTLTCPIHGDFEQTPNDHLSGKGCKLCAREEAPNTSAFGRDRFKDKRTILYYIEIFSGIYKIGLTTKSVKKRFQGTEVKTIFSRVFSDGAVAYDIEKQVLKATRCDKVPKDFKFKIHGWTEFRTKPFICEVMAAIALNSDCH